MDNTILKKRLSSFRTDGGRLSKVSDEVLVDILRAWENWTGTSKEFYQSLGTSKQQLGSMIKKGKRLAKAGGVSQGEFRELKLDNLISIPNSGSCQIELCWQQDKVIRFAEVGQLVDFLKKVA